MNWTETNRYCKDGVKLADRHYNRQKIGSNQFVPPGKPLVLISKNLDAVWVSLMQKHQDHEWKGYWSNTLFRNEGECLSSDLILEALAITIHKWGQTSPGIITFIDTKKVKPKKDYGYCYLKAGFKEFGYTKVNKLLVLGLNIENFPKPEKSYSDQNELFEI